MSSIAKGFEQVDKLTSQWAYNDPYRDPSVDYPLPNGTQILIELWLYGTRKKPRITLVRQYGNLEAVIIPCLDFDDAREHAIRLYDGNYPKSYEIMVGTGLSMINHLETLYNEYMEY